MPDLESVEHNPFGVMLEPVEHNPHNPHVQLESYDGDPFGIAATNVPPQAQSEAMGQAVNAAAQSYLSRPSWLEQARKLNENEDWRTLRPSDERIKFGTGMVGPTALGINQ